MTCEHFCKRASLPVSSQQPTAAQMVAEAAAQPAAAQAAQAVAAVADVADVADVAAVAAVADVADVADDGRDSSGGVRGATNSFFATNKHRLSRINCRVRQLCFCAFGDGYSMACD